LGAKEHSTCGGEIRRLGALGRGVGGAALAIVGDGKLRVRLGERWIGGDRLLVARHRVGNLPAFQQLVAAH